MPQCSKCFKPIIFRRQVTYPDARPVPDAKANPIDAAPSEAGNILLSADGETYQIVPAPARAEYAGRLHVSHYATCPNAKDFGRGGYRR